MSQPLEFILNFIRHLLSATANASLYGMDHPQVSRLADRAFESLVTALDDRAEFSLVIIENELVIDGYPQAFNLFLDRFVQTLHSRGIGHIKLITGISRLEVTDFIASMAFKGAEAPQMVISSEHLRLGRVDLKEAEGYAHEKHGVRSGSGDAGFGVSSDQDGSGSLRIPGLVSLPALPAEEMARFKEIYEAVKHHQKLKINGVFEIVSDFI